MRVYIIILALFISTSGYTQNKKSERDTRSSESVEIKESVMHNGYIKSEYFTVGNDSKVPDSTKIYYSKDGQIESMYISYKYPSSTKILSESYFPDGKIKSTRYNNEKPLKNDTIYIYYYPSGKVSLLQTILKDSRELPKLYKSYYESGRIKEIGVQDMYNATIISTGTWKIYDEFGNLIETTFYHPDEFGKDYKVVTSYKDGVQTSKKIYNNDELYETELQELEEIPR